MVGFLKDTDRIANQEPLKIFKRHFGFVPKVFRAQMLRPDLVEAEANLIQAILLSTSSLNRRQKEFIILAVSAANQSTYFVSLHTQILQILGVKPEECDQIAIDYRRAPLTETDHALLNFARKLATDGQAFSVNDIDLLRQQGISDAQILEAVLLVGLTNLLNTIQTGLGTEPDFKPRMIFPLKEMYPAEESERPMFERPLTDESVSDDPDTEFVTRVQAGDTDAFEPLVRRHGRRVYRSLLGILGSAEEAEDAMQDAFLKAFQHLAAFEGRSRFSTWLVRIAINTGVQRLRSRPKLESLEADDEHFKPRRIQAWQDDPEKSYSREELRRLVEQEVMKLPAKYRVALMLRDLEELSTEEAANALGLTIPGMKARVLRGRLMLRESLVPYFAKEGAKATA
jgi:RNA polymerase sigma-70 factor (ECF subfamily)